MCKPLKVVILEFGLPKRTVPADPTLAHHLTHAAGATHRRPELRCRHKHASLPMGRSQRLMKTCHRFVCGVPVWAPAQATAAGVLFECERPSM
jgi:hypothetical protein